MSLLPATHQDNLAIYRGIAKFAPKNADGTYQSEIVLSPSSKFTIAIKSTDVQYVSAESGLNEILDKTVIAIDRTATLDCNNMSDEIKALFIVGTQNAESQASGSVTGEHTPFIFPGRTVQLGGALNNGAGIFGVTSPTATVASIAWSADRVNVVGDIVKPTTGTHLFIVTVPGVGGATEPTWTTSAGASNVDGAATLIDLGAVASLVADTDFSVDQTYGVLSIPDTGVLATLFGNVPAAIRALGKSFQLVMGYTRAAASFDQIATSSYGTIEGKFYFYEQNPKGDNSNWFAPSTVFSPNGNMDLKSGNNYGVAGFSVSFQKPAVGSSLYKNGVPAN